MSGTSGSESVGNKFRPLQDRLIVERLEQQETTAGGIVIPDAHQEKPQRGRVIATGKGKVKEDGTVRPLDVKVDDTVLFGKQNI